MIEKKFRSSKVQSELSDYIIQNYEERKERSLLEKKWNTFYDIYRGIESKGTYSGRADLDWASAYLAVEILVPRVYNALFPRPKWFEMVGVEQSDEKQAQIMSAYLRQKLDKDVHFRRKMIASIRYCSIMGTFIAKTPYRRDIKNVPVKKQATFNNFFGLIGPQFTQEKVLTFDSIDFQLMDLFDFYPADDFIDNIQDQPFVITRTVEYSDLLYKKKYDKETGEGIYENLDKIDLECETKTSEENMYKKFRKAVLGLKSREYESKLSTIDFIEYQGVYDEEEIVVIVANDGKENPIVSAEVLNTPDMEKTYIMGKWIDVPGEFWGMSVVDRVEKAIYELNDRVNQTMDATSLMINPMWLNSDADIHEGTLRVFPGRIINTSSEKGLSAVHPPVEILAPAYNAIQSLMNMIQKTTGATQPLEGNVQQAGLARTATGMLSVIKEANARLNLIIQGLEDTAIIPFLRRAYKYAQFYAERKDIVRIVGKSGIEYQEVDPASILGDYDFRTLGAQSVGSEEVVTQQMINYLNIVARIPGAMQNFDIMKLASKIGERMLGLEDADELLMQNSREEEETDKAISENMAAMEGIPPVISSTDNHRLHIEIHNGFLQDQRSQEFPRATELLNIHIKDHEAMEKGQGIHPIYNQGNRSQTAGAPPQEQPRGTDMNSMIQQIAQPSQEGTM